MPFMKERQAAFYAKEILRSVNGSELAENAVVDGTSVPLNGDGRRILETGTVMVWSGAIGTSKVRPVPGVAQASGQDETQTIVRSATADEGSVKLEVPGYGTTAAIPFGDVTAAGLQAALRTISGLGDVTVALNTNTFTVTFPDRDVQPIVVRANTLEAANVPVTLTVATTQQGAVRAEDVAGIVMHTTEFWPDADLDREQDAAPIALFTRNCDFATQQLTGYAAHAVAVKAAMTGAGNGRCTNCSFN